MTTNSRSAVETRIASAADLETIQQVHTAAFPNFFLTKMGPNFVKEYYATLLQYPHGKIIIASMDSESLGFAATFMDPQKFLHFMAARKARFILPTALGLLRRPWLLPRVLFNKNRVMDDSTTPLEHSHHQCELSSIGVSPNTKNLGLGKMLMTAVHTFAIDNNAQEIVLTTDANDNDAVNKFYSKLGYEKTSTFLSGGNRQMNSYRLKLAHNTLSKEKK